ncbi:MAG: class I adenylate-forming enzyme family protein [bacterium]
MQVHDLLLLSEDRNPDAPLVWEQGAWYSYGTVVAQARRVARELVETCDVRKGQRVAVYWENSLGAIVASFGVWLSGAVLVPLNTDLRGADLTFQLEHSDAVAVISGKKQFRHLLPVIESVQGVHSVIADVPISPDALSARFRSWNDAVDTGHELATPVRTIDVDLAAIVYTSGSTGRPKGVMLSHLNIVSNMVSIADYLRLGSDDRILMVLPHFYIYGLSLVLTHVLVGGGIILENRFMYPNTVLETMTTVGATGFAGVPSTFSILLARSTVRETGFPSLRYVTQAGGAMPVKVQKETADAFAPAALYIMYGATEAAPRLSYLDPADLEHKWGSIGVPIPNVDLFVADQDGSPLPPGEEGELVARGSNIMAGYWKDPEASGEVIRSGLYYTGDLGVRDEEGFLYVTGRAKDIIKVKGFRVSPKEIEEHIIRSDAVSEAAVVGVPDDVQGEVPVAFLVPKDDDVDTQAISVALQRELPAYKVPRHYVVVGELPKGSAGKVLKTRLREQYEEGKRGKE